MTRAGPVLVLATLLGLFGCDHGTKHLAKAHLEGRSALELIPGVFDLRYTENTDTAFSLLGRVLEPDVRHVLLTVTASLAVLALAVFILRRFADLGTLQRLGAALVMGGALGNLSERVLRGYVIDFLHLHSWPVFNVADVAICLGAPLLLFVGHAAQPKAEHENTS